jgi:actin-related protein
VQTVHWRRKPEYPEKTTDLPQGTDKLYLDTTMFDFSCHIFILDDPVLDAWKGARKFAISPDRSRYSITKAEYDEYGGEYLKEHLLSNKYFPSPIQIKQEK